MSGVYMSGYLFGKLAEQTRMKKTALEAARMVLVRQQPVTKVAKTLGVPQPLVSRAVSRIILESKKENLRKTITDDPFNFEALSDGLREVTFVEVMEGMGKDAYLKFVLDIKLKEKSRTGSAFCLLCFTPDLSKEPIPTQNFLLSESRAIVRDLMRDNDILVQVNNDFFVITDNITPKISGVISARYQDRFLQKLNLKIEFGLSFFDCLSIGMSAEKMIAKALSR